MRRTCSISSSVSSGKRLTATTALEPELPDDPQVAGEVGRAGLDRLGAPVGIATVVLERLHRGHEHDGTRRQLAHPADDVEELLHAHVGAEARLGDDDVAELERDTVGDEGVVAVRDVREGAAVDEGRLSLECLDEVRLDRVLQQHGHRAGRLQLLRGDELAAPRRSDRDPAEPPRRSRRSLATATIAITSEAAVMSQPVWRG